MKILFAASEVAPFIKTGGLADVAGSLPPALAAQGHEVKVILPLYEGIGEDWRSQMTFLTHFDVNVSWRHAYCGIFELERDGVTYWFVDNEYYFKRWQIYGHFDDCERFAFFSRAVIETPGYLDWSPDIIHCNDWQTALVPVYLLEDKYRIPQLAGAKSVYTIHNIEYQGRYGDQVLQDILGLDRSYFNDGMLAYYDDVNLMKGAIMASNYVTTVSPTYAQELRLPFYAHGLAGVVNDRAGRSKASSTALIWTSTTRPRPLTWRLTSPSSLRKRARPSASWPCSRPWAFRKTRMSPLSPVFPAWWATRVSLWSPRCSTRSWTWTCR
jgi:starch synthase